MVDDESLNAWFCREVLPLERALTRFISRNWRTKADVMDLRQEIYERVLVGARNAIPNQARAYVYAVARNHLINRSKRERIVSIDLVADLERLEIPPDFFAAERELGARDELRRALAGLDRLPPRCREVVRLRKVEGLTTREVADRMGTGIDTVEKQLTLGIRAIADYMLGGTGKVQRRSRAGFRSKRGRS
jgi:RNA polymerase sigma-70 factor (ECF subfamily)